jgi:hypothetical protein
LLEAISSFVVAKEPLVHDRMEVRKEEKIKIAERVFVFMNIAAPAAYLFNSHYGHLRKFGTALMQ